MPEKDIKQRQQTAENDPLADFSIAKARQARAAGQQPSTQRRPNTPSPDPRQPGTYRGQRPPQGQRRPTERDRQNAAYEAAYRQANAGLANAGLANPGLANAGQANRPVYRHRKLGRPNGAAVLFTVLLLTIAGLSIGQIVQNRSTAKETKDPWPTAEPETVETMPEGETSGISEADMVLWKTETIDNTLLGQGDLILVNYNYPYADADTIAVKDVYGNKNKYYQVANTSIRLTPIALEAFNAMTEAFYTETGSDDMMIVSGYRNVQSQRDIYNDRVATQGEELAALYVATPGYSEHHTGLAMDLSFYTDSGASVSIEEYEHGSWIDENCAAYGFVLRYPSDKVDITKIGYEFWHYRYVGKPHAQIMTDLHLCLEEYLDYMKEYTTDTKLLWIQPSGLLTEVSVSALPSEGTLLYYVPAEKGDTTSLLLPRGNTFTDTTISGNNVDGFIVTVTAG